MTTAACMSKALSGLPGGGSMRGAGDGAVTRADAAEMLVAAFDHLNAASLLRDLFQDAAGVPEDVVLAMEGLYHAGVTKG